MKLANGKYEVKLLVPDKTGKAGFDIIQHLIDTYGKSTTA